MRRAFEEPRLSHSCTVRHTTLRRSLARSLVGFDRSFANPEARQQGSSMKPPCHGLLFSLGCRPAQIHGVTPRSSDSAPLIQTFARAKPRSSMPLVVGRGNGELTFYAKLHSAFSLAHARVGRHLGIYRIQRPRRHRGCSPVIGLCQLNQGFQSEMRLGSIRY